MMCGRMLHAMQAASAAAGAVTSRRCPSGGRLHVCDVKSEEMAFQAEMAGLTVLQFDRLLLGLAVYFFGAVI